MLLKLLALAGWLLLGGCFQAGVLLWVEVALNWEGPTRRCSACKGALPDWRHPTTAACALT